jgi:hypothetical protein
MSPNVSNSSLIQQSKNNSLYNKAVNQILLEQGITPIKSQLLNIQAPSTPRQSQPNNLNKQQFMLGK